MTIQFSVVIWTIINFILLYLVLNFLLFKPMLKFMDKRNDKINQGRLSIAKRQEATMQKDAETAAFFAEKDRLLKEKVEAGIALTKEECLKSRIAAEAEQKAAVIKDKEALAEEEALLKETLARAVPVLSDKVVQSLLEKGL